MWLDVIVYNRIYISLAWSGVCDEASYELNGALFLGHHHPFLLILEYSLLPIKENMNTWFVIISSAREDKQYYFKVASVCAAVNILTAGITVRKKYQHVKYSGNATRNTWSIYVDFRRWIYIASTDMIFVQLFTHPDFQAKYFTPVNGVICDIVHSPLNSVNMYLSVLWAFFGQKWASSAVFGEYTQVNERTQNFCLNYARENVLFWINLHHWQRIYTAAGSDGRDKSHLSASTRLLTLKRW